MCNQLTQRLAVVLCVQKLSLLWFECLVKSRFRAHSPLLFPLNESDTSQSTFFWGGDWGGSTRLTPRGLIGCLSAAPPSRLKSLIGLQMVSSGTSANHPRLFARKGLIATCCIFHQVFRSTCSSVVGPPPREGGAACAGFSFPLQEG